MLGTATPENGFKAGKEVGSPARSLATTRLGLSRHRTCALKPPCTMAAAAAAKNCASSSLLPSSSSSPPLKGKFHRMWVALGRGQM